MAEAEGEAEPKRNVLFYLAAEGVIPVLGGCAGAIAGGPVGGVAGVAIGHAVEKAINLFGKGIVARWRAWFAQHPKEAEAAVAELAALPLAQAREAARSIFLDLAPDADAQDLSLAVEFLTAIPRSVSRALVPNPTGGRSLPATVGLDDPRALLQLLPADIPPYASAAELPGTPYRLVELIGSGGFGAVYRAESPTLQHLPLAIKFCLDRSLLPALNQERSNLERLMRAGGRGSNNVVRLYGYDLEHATPYLVYEFVPGGDLTQLLAARVAALGQPPSSDEVLAWITQITEGLAFAHRTGLVHRDLKPANVLVDGDTLKLGDFGLGGVAVARAAVRSRIGASTVDYLSLADQASLFRGAGTPLYMSPEQRRGATPDPRHDLYALGVVWFQLLVGDVSRELHPGWAKELTVRCGVPPSRISLIERCVGWYDERPRHAGELLELIRELPDQPSAPLPLAEPLTSPAVSAPTAETAVNRSAPTPVPQATTGMRWSFLTSALAKLSAAHAQAERWGQRSLRTDVLWGFVPALLVSWLFGEWAYSARHDYYTFPMAFDSKGVMDWRVNGYGVGLGLVIWFLLAMLFRVQTRVSKDKAEKRVLALIDELASDCPAEVASWGGRVVLRDPVSVRRIQDDLARHAPLEHTTRTKPSTATGEARQRGVTAAVARLDSAYRELADMAKWRFEYTAFYGLLVAIPFGVFFGFVVLYFSKHGLIGTVGGLLGGLMVWGLYIYVIRTGVKAVAEDLRKQAEERLAELEAEFPAEVAMWGGRSALRHAPTVRQIHEELDPRLKKRPQATPVKPPESPVLGVGWSEPVKQLLADPFQKPVFLGQLRVLDKTLRETTKAADTCHVLRIVFPLVFGIGGAVAVAVPTAVTRTLPVWIGIPLGLAVGGLIAFIFVFAFSAAIREQQRKQTAAVQLFASAYPEVAEKCGGEAALRNANFVHSIRDAVDDSPKPTFWGRLFNAEW